jgi:hypothetical protein
MKKHLLYLTFLLVLVFAANKSGAQAYQPFPTGAATWEVLRCFYFYPSGWHDKYTFTMDGSESVYEGLPFKNIYIVQHHLPGTVHDTIYPKEFFGGIREVDKQVFIYQKWASVDTSVMMVYDFNETDPGDTIYTNVLSGNPYLFGHLVTGVDSVMVGNQYHKRLHLQDVENEFNTEYWIEGVGSSWGLPFATFWSITDNSYDLSCFYSGDQLKYVNDSPQFSYCIAPVPEISCDSITTSIEDHDPGRCPISSFSPILHRSHITLKQPGNSFHDKVIVDIYDLRGVLVCSRILNKDQQTIYVGNLSSGIYMLVFKTKDWVKSRKLVVQR